MTHLRYVLDERDRELHVRTEVQELQPVQNAGRAQNQADAQEDGERAEEALGDVWDPLVLPLVDEALEYGDPGGESRVHREHDVVHLHRVQPPGVSLRVLRLKVGNVSWVISNCIYSLFSNGYFDGSQ